MLKLCDLIALAKVNLGHFKIHCATASGSSPLDAFFDGKFKQWQEHQGRRNFGCSSIISLIHLRADKWLFAGVWSVLGVTPRTNGKDSWFEYSTSEVSELEHLAGRAIVSFVRDFRAAYLVGLQYADQLLVSQLLEEKLSQGDFPGYSSIRITFEQLRRIVTHDVTTWRAALKSVAGVYLIADTSCGKHYVGSAYGTEGLWGRWSMYAQFPHGNNKELRELLQVKGDAHAKHFQFSILEICDPLTTNDVVFERESHWKNALLSRQHGYNSN